MKVYPYLLVFLFLFLLSGCAKDEIELILDDDVPSREAVNGEKSLPLTEASLSPEQLIEISPETKVKILVRADGAPGMYLGEDGRVYGFYVDLEAMVMEEMGQSYEFVAYDDLGPVIEGIKSGYYHMALATPDLPDYRAFVNLSLPFEVLHYVVFVKDGSSGIYGESREEMISGLFGKDVGVQTRGHIYQFLRDYKEINLIDYPTTTKALEALNDGLLDAVPDVKRIGLYYAESEGWNIHPMGDSILEHNICTSFSKTIHPSLMGRYNDALGKIIDSGRLEKLYIDYFGPMDSIYKPWI